MPGAGRKKSKKKNGKKQAGENKESKENTNPTEVKKTVTNDPTPVKAKANLDDAILVEDVVHLKDFGNNNQTTDAKSPFDAFVSKFDVGEHAKQKESKPAAYNKKPTKEQGVKFERDFSDFVNNNDNAMKNRNIPQTKIEKKPTNKSNGDLKTIEDFIAEGVPREIVMMKHPLANTWVFWWFRNDKSRTWEQNQEKIATVDTIEDFWQIYNFIEPASQLGQGCDYAVFKKGIQPDWEDFQNMSGGRWIINSDKTNRGDILDSHWLEIIFILIGEHAGEFAHMMNGAVINIRPKGDKLAVWLRDAHNMAGVMEIGKLVKSRLGLRDRINFTIHREDSKGNNRSRFGSQNSPSKICV
eukprot:TRINITY_DN8454_c0_g1_i1.p1 TRINITY_DN8454_c0_g1~~TRINITY_DN8454_c0_g1_i1.p1  ORF type:complete len:355 (-),score=111.01 TRINITY_DN8454_c0_g1_i1:117-1181(-)